MDSIIRVVGAISLWSVEIIMQLRVYALFKCSKRVYYFLPALSDSIVEPPCPRLPCLTVYSLRVPSLAFYGSWLIMPLDEEPSLPTRFVYLCRGVRTFTLGSNGPNGYLVSSLAVAAELLAQSTQATAYEGVLFGFALFKTLESTADWIQKGRRVSLYSLLLRDNILYFLAYVLCLSCPSPSNPAS